MGRTLITLAALALSATAFGQATKVTINPDNVLEINGKKIFPIGFTMAPPLDGKTPDGKDGLQELRDAGGTFFRTGPNQPKSWDDAYIAEEKQWMDAAAKHGMYCLPWLKELSNVPKGNAEKEQALRNIIRTFKDNPALSCWKGADEPEWGKEKVENLINARRIIAEEDPNHPLWIVQAPRGTVDTMRAYNDTMDITGQDVYPISYPPGIHSLLPNHDISLIGDHTDIMQAVVQGKKPIWMTLQISWSGVNNEGRTRRMPTFPEERFMTYQAIIHGARGLIYFGGTNKPSMSADDLALGWNWRFWNNVLKRVVEEVGDKSPLAPALVARDSEIPVIAKIVGVDHARAKGIELRVREVGDDIFLFACQRDHDTVQIKFQGVPPVDETGILMFEEPRTVKVDKGAFTDWFAPFEVHVYKFHRTPTTQP
jgi:hypothetical protein